jgi:hypothetical protein
MTTTQTLRIAGEERCQPTDAGLTLPIPFSFVAMVSQFWLTIKAKASVPGLDSGSEPVLLQPVVGESKCLLLVLVVFE